MLITCISASNVKSMKDSSASTKACTIVRDIINENSNEEVKVNVIPLVEYDFKPCTMCAECCEKGKCINDESFNEIYSMLQQSDGIFLVVPHYAPIPSKLMMIMEKLQEFCFIGYCKDNNSHFSLRNKPVAIIGHGGQQTGEPVLKYYKKAILDLVANSLAGVSMKIIGVNDEWPNGVTFGLKDMVMSEGNVLPSMVHDWDNIRKVIEPLVNNLLIEIQ